MDKIRVATFAGPGAGPVIQTVPWPKIPNKAALIKVGACGVCGTDLHILKGHWPKPLPWPFTLGHEIGGVLVEVGSEFKEDFMSKPLTVGSKVMIPPLMPCGRCALISLTMRGVSPGKAASTMGASSVPGVVNSAPA